MLSNREKLRKLGIIACNPTTENKNRDISDKDYHKLLELLKSQTKKRTKYGLYQKKR